MRVMVLLVMWLMPLKAKFKQLNIPVEFMKIHNDADGTFPNGIPNPILVENRDSTRNAVIEHHADMGIAWDGDFDRCFYLMKKANLLKVITSSVYWRTSVIINNLVRKLCMTLAWFGITFDVIEQYQGEAIQSKSGHSYIKEKMR